MWVKYLSDAKDHKAGEIVEISDASAKTLIDNGIVAEADAPEAVTKATTELAGSLKSYVEGVAKTTADTIVKELTVAREKAPRLNIAGTDGGTEATFRVPAEVKRYGSLRNIKGTSPDGRSAEQRAYEFGMWMLGMWGNERADRFCAEKGFKYIPEDGAARTKVSRENNNTSSGFLVPDQFENDLIDLREKFGVFRQYAKIVPMASDTRSDPRRTGGLTVYVVGESTAPTASDKTWDRVRLTAKKIGVLTRYTRELSEDAVINIGDDLAGEIAYAFGAFEDDCGFNGTGAASYAGITGWRSAIANVSSNASTTVAGVTGAWSSVVMADFNKVVGTLPLFAYTGGTGVAWYCSQAFYGSVMQKLEIAGGGNTATDIANGTPAYKFLGFPVRISQKMPTATASTGIPVLFGNLGLGCRLGDRRSTSIRMSDVALNAFEQDEIAIVGFERFDIVVHDPGTSTQAGPVVALALA